VERYIDEWEAMTDRLGFWLDMKHPYRTYEGTYIESVVVEPQAALGPRPPLPGLQGRPLLPRCQTSLSSHELSQGYRTMSLTPPSS